MDIDFQLLMDKAKEASRNSVSDSDGEVIIYFNFFAGRHEIGNCNRVLRLPKKLTRPRWDEINFGFLHMTRNISNIDRMMIPIRFDRSIGSSWNNPNLSRRARIGKTIGAVSKYTICEIGLSSSSGSQLKTASTIRSICIAITIYLSVVTTT